MTNYGKFITIEGCEGVGKSTQVRLLKEYCGQNNIDAVFTREPGGTDIAEKIRSVILDPQNGGMDNLTELLLYQAARAQHVAELIVPMLKKGKIVFCDRFIDSTFAYQAYGRGIDIDLVKKLNDIGTMGLNRIDCTLFLDLPPDEGFRRKGGADKGDRLEKENIDFFKRVYEGFCFVADTEPERFVRVDVGGTKEESHEKIIKSLKQKAFF